MYFMYLTIACLVVALICLVNAFLKLKSDKVASKKMRKLSAEAGLLGLVVGCLGAIVGFIDLTLYSEAAGNSDPYQFAIRLKTALYNIAMGVGTFTITRLGILIYTWATKAEELNE